jgi:hypothetical protein
MAFGHAETGRSIWIIAGNGILGRKSWIMDWKSYKGFVAAFALAACEGAPIAHVDYSVGYRPGEARAVGNMVPTVVMGDPFQIPQPDFATTVVDAMQGQAVGPTSFFVATNPNAAFPVIMLFTPSSNVTGETLCTRPPAAQPVVGNPPGSSVPLAATLCRGDSYLAYAHGTVDATSGPSSETFRRGIGQFTRLLFPARNPQTCTSC